MRVVIRADASIHLGTGHVMRCLTLAEMLRAQGADVSLICREYPGHLCDTLESKGFSVTRLPGTRDGGLDPDWELDARQVQEILSSEGRLDWLVVDHYGLDERWESRMRAHADRILVIDDLANRRHDCDVLLDQNYYRYGPGRYQGLVGPDAMQLLGPRFALLREEFTKARRSSRRDFVQPSRLLVFFGGSDRSNETAKALEALKLLGNPALSVDVVIGPANPHAACLRDIARELPNVTCHQAVTNMAERMEQADLFLGAGGSTAWERCCMGLPSVVVTIAPNQEETTGDLAEAGYLWYLGTREKVTARAIAHALGALLQNPALLRYFSRKGRELVDGLGAQRVAKAMIPLEVQMRRATAEDCEAVFRWRNAEETRRYIFDPTPLTWEQHEAWFMCSLQNPERVILIGERDGQPVGVVRYDLSGTTATVSVYLVPGIHGQGLGPPLLRAGSAWLRSFLPHVQSVRAEILPANQASLKAFRQAGYSEHHVVYEEVLHP